MYDPSQKLPQDPYPLRPGDPEPRNHARDWLSHVEAGRIGSGAASTARHLRRHVRNELMVLGRVV